MEDLYMKKIMCLFAIVLIATVFLASPVSADELAYGELEGIAFQDGFIPSKENIIHIPNYFSPAEDSNDQATKTLNDYTDEIISEWDSYTANTIDISDLGITISQDDLLMLQAYCL